MHTLNPTEIQALLEALDDEYKSWATYQQVIDDFGPIRPFINIVEAEQRHMNALLQLCHQYGVEAPVNPWIGKTPRYTSEKHACIEAVKGEIENAALYDRVLKSTERADILEVYRALQSASIDRHLPAFQRCTERG